VLVGSVLLLLSAWSLGYEELFVPALAGLIAVALGIFWVRALPTLRITRTINPDRVVAGSSVAVELQISNPGGRASLPLRAHDVIRAHRAEVAIPRIAPRSSSTLRYSLPAVRRGMVEVGPLTVGRDDPLGVCQTQRVLGGRSKLWIHPRSYQISLFPSGRIRDLEGPAADRAQGSVTFHSLREYVPGDDLRRVHWRTSARLGNLLVREHVDASQPRLAVVLDTDRRAYDEGTFEAAIEAAASIGSVACLQRFPLWMTTSSGRIVYDRTLDSSPVTFLDELAALEWSEATDLSGTIRAIDAARRASAVVVVTGRRTVDAPALLQLLNTGYDHAVVAYLDATVHAAAATPFGRVLEIVASDSATFAQLWNGTLT
jgi:uncharacterized protein (DUF58 family)